LRPPIVRDRAGAASLSRERYGDNRAKQQQQNGDRTELLLPQRGAVLPEGILEPQVIKAQTSSEAIAYFAVSADDMTIEQITTAVTDEIGDVSGTVDAA
jgi:multidrug efflux pump subunit AcrB